jgi:hypothetical protein
MMRAYHRDYNSAAVVRVTMPIRRARLERESQSNSLLAKAVVVISQPLEQLFLRLSAAPAKAF